MNSPQTVDTNRRREAVAAPLLSPHERAELLAARLAESLARAWSRGERLRAEDLLGARGFLADFPDAAWIVICEEIRQRRILGPPPNIDEFVARFPAWEGEIRRAMAPPPSRTGPRFPECGETLAGCRLVAELGRGVEGRVFLASQDDLAGRPVVLKLTPCSGSEHLSLARLLHSHIVPLYFVQDCPDRNLRVLAMPYLGGASLEQILDELAAIPCTRRTGADVLRALDQLQRAIPMPALPAGPTRAMWERSSYPVALCWLGACLAEAMHYAHERGLVHLDLKPGNVLLAADGQPLLLDFHLARAPVVAGSDSPEWFGGTPGFMAPEQRLAFDAVRAGQSIPAAVNGQSDLFALGMVLYVALGGEAPTGGESVRPLRHWNPTVSQGLSDILGKCVEADPTRRYPNGAALADDLRRQLSNQPLRGVRNRSLLERWRKWRRRRPQGLAVGLLAGTVLLALAVLGSIGVNRIVGRSQEARAALAEGQTCLRENRPEEAERAFARGLDRTAGIPGTADLTRELEEARGTARRELVARAIHTLADRLRFLGDPQSYSRKAAKEIADRCAQLWDRRDLVASADDAVQKEQIRTDLLDLAVLGTRWHIRAAGAAEQNEARRQGLAVLDEVERLAGTSPALARERAGYLTALGDQAGARAALREAADLPRSAWDQYALGRALLDAGEMDAASMALEAAVRNRPGDFWPNFYQGVCAHRSGRYLVAVEAFRVCVALAPNAAPCYCNRGLALAALNRDSEAQRDFDRSLALNPELAPARLARAALFLKQGHLEAAAADLQRALADGADPGAVYFNLALVEIARHDDSAARRALRACLEQRPDHAGARKLLDRLEMR